MSLVYAPSADQKESRCVQNVTLQCKTQFYDSQENIVALEANKLAVLDDLSGYIVAESANVLLICKKENEQRIRQFVADVQVNFEGDFI